MSNSEFSVKKLIGATNYRNWSFAMDNFMDSKSFDDTIGPSFDDAAVAIKTNGEKLKERKSFLVMGIYTSLLHIWQCKTALEIWQKLHSTYEDQHPTYNIQPHLHMIGHL